MSVQRVSSTGLAITFTGSVIPRSVLHHSPTSSDVARLRPMWLENEHYSQAHGDHMPLSRREFLRSTAAGIGPGTALASLVGLGASLAPATARAQELRIKDAKTTPSVCPYCSVGCATLIHTVDGKIVNIEGDPRSPHTEGCLCPKGAAIFQLHVNPNRPTQVLHRAPGATEWEVWDIDRAMDRVAELVKKTRDETFIERLPNGALVNMTPAI